MVRSWSGVSSPRTTLLRRSPSDAASASSRSATESMSLTVLFAEDLREQGDEVILRLAGAARGWGWLRRILAHLKSLRRRVPVAAAAEAPCGRRRALSSKRVLFVGPPGLGDACRAAAEHGLGWLELEGASNGEGAGAEAPATGALTLHTSLVEQLPALLRVYINAAAMLYGDVHNADLLKIHIGSGKLTLMRFDDFDGRALPRMLERVKIKLREQDVDVFGYGELFEPPYLYRKSRFINEEYPGYPEQVVFDEALERLEAQGLIDLSGYGPPAAELLATLKRHRWEIDGLALRRMQTPPELDDPCGQFLTFRDLIECGETWQRLAAEGDGFDNRPKQLESYSALLELAEQVLDPVIDWFGMIRLTYGFCSPALSRQIPGRIDPKRDQHAAHERNRLGNQVCDRLGAAVDFIIPDEDMLEVAQWIVANAAFDRLYFYGGDRPIHVSCGPENSRQIVRMVRGSSGRLIPKITQEAAFLRL